MKVEFMAHSGDDLLVVDAARASFGKSSEWETAIVYGEDEHGDFEEEIHVLSARDSKLLNFLAREHHLLPFRHPQITLRCKAPIFLARQLGKHQVGFSWSEESRRYITNEPEFYTPTMWRKKAENVKQGSSSEKIKLPVTGKCAVCGTPLTYPEDEAIRAAHVARVRFCSGKCQMRSHRARFPYDNRMRHWKSSAKDRGLEFTIVAEDLTWPDKCPYLDVELDYGGQGGDKHDATASLDRIDSSKGYVPGNVQIISNLANRMKNDASSEDLVKFAKNVLAVHTGTFVEASSSYEGYLDSIKAAYKRLIESGVAPEQARMILPVSQEVTWVWTGSLLGFYQMYAQRSFPTAQKEARDFAALVEEIIEPLYPVSWAALKEHQPWEEGKKDG